MEKEIKATINVSISEDCGCDTNLTIDEICAPLEEQGWVIDQAWISEEGN